MCGVAGLVCSRESFAAARSHVDAIVSWQHARGPDDRGFVEFTTEANGIRLGNNRLAIIDLSSLGHQPMADAAGEFHITYNGEIYNHVELRRELELLGAEFRSTSDTEVILAAWRQWGEGAIARLNGMFAFAIYDARAGALTLVRDRFGVKPLFWARLPQGIVFASSVMALARIVGAAPNLEYCARGAFYREYDRGGRDSPYADVHALRPGTLMRIDCRSGERVTKERTWYSLREALEGRTAALARATQEEISGTFEALFDDAISVRLRSDVPVAISLSGGLDSSSVGALAAAQLGAVEGFSFGSPGDPESEGPLIDLFSRQTGIRVHYTWPAVDRAFLGNAFDHTLQGQEAPFSGISVIAQNLVYRAAREAGFKVILGGQGADEALCGYAKFHLFVAIIALRDRRLGDGLAALVNLAWTIASGRRRLRDYWKERGRYLGAGARRNFDLLDLPVPAVDLGLAKDATLADRQRLDVTETSLPTLLRYEDRNSMQHSVESRLPFMDYRLIEFALALPAAMKMRHGYGKWILRSSVRDWVPDAIRMNRVKRGFDVTQNWVRLGLGDHLRERVAAGWEEARPWVRKRITPDTLPSDDDLARSSTALDEMIFLAWAGSLQRDRSALSGSAAPARIAAVGGE